MEKKLEIECPMCDAEIPLGSDPQPGLELLCSYCETPLRLKKKKEDDSLYLQEDF